MNEIRGRLTSRQWALLSDLATRTDPAGGPEVAAALDQPIAGAHRTAATLARKGLIYRLRYREGRVAYEISPHGRAALTQHHRRGAAIEPI